ncbi:MAG: fibronectin type III domain-containing protein [Ignavibacteriales bacterium]
MKKICLLITITFSLIFITEGCVDSLNAPDKLAPSIEVYKPATNDTISVGKYEINYYALDDQKVSFIELYVNGKFKAHFDPAADGANPAVFWNVDSSLMNTTASYYLIAYDPNGNSAKSPEKTNIFIREITEPPAAPQNLVLWTLSDNSVNLTWDDSSSNEDEFQVYRKDGISGSFRVIKVLPPNSQSTNDYGLLPTETYKYKIRASNKYGYSESKEVSTVGEKSSPAYNLTAVAKGASKVHLSWGDNAINELGFVIERKIYGASSFTQIGMTLPNVTDFDDTKDLSPSTVYIYRVAAKFQTGLSEWSNEKMVTTLWQDILPPSNLTAAYDSKARKVNLTWVINNNIASDTRIERKSGASGIYSEIGKVAYGVTAFADTSLTVPNTYYYRVRGFIGGNNYTDYSEETSISLTSGSLSVNGH